VEIVKESMQQKVKYVQFVANMNLSAHFVFHPLDQAQHYRCISSNREPMVNWGRYKWLTSAREAGATSIICSSVGLNSFLRKLTIWFGIRSQY